MKKFLLSAMAVIVLILAGLFVYITTIDWNQHKDKIAEQFSLVTGKIIAFDGKVSFSLLPAPYLTAENVKVYNPGQTTGRPLAVIKNLVAKLSLQPLLHGNFDVKHMSLVKPEIYVEVNEDGGLNWYSPLAESQKNMQESDVQLDSVTIESASLDFVYPKYETKVRLDNLNAEVIAQSVLGPYHIEGSYVKDNNPEGFAISVGKISDRMPTSLNMVLNHPASETFLRFDGSFLYQNMALSGNLIFDSKKLQNFSEATFKQFKFDKNYDYPLAVSMEVKTNKSKVELNNLVIKYGTSAGAGNVLLPLPPENPNLDVQKVWHPKVELAFAMTDFDVAPLLYWLQGQFDKYNRSEVKYQPEWGFDLAADIKAVKASYHNQDMRDLALSLDIVDNVIVINNFTARLPGETDISLSGSVFEKDALLHYGFNTTFTTDNFADAAAWLGYTLEAPVQGVYRKARGSIKCDGNMQKVQISPIEITLDKTTFRGDIGLINGERLSMLLLARADSINFDNYVKPLPEEVANKNFAERMAYRFSKLGWLKNLDMEMMLDLNLGIYENMPFETTYLEGRLSNGRLQINDLSIGTLMGANLRLDGEISGFGETPKFANLKYNLVTADAGALVNKLGLSAPRVDFQKLKAFEAEGIASGDLTYFATKTAAKLGKINAVFGGEVQMQPEGAFYKGSVEVKSPDFVDMLNSLNFKYSPKVVSLGVFNFKSSLSGTAQNLKLRNLAMNVGLNNFSGGVDYSVTNERPKFAIEGNINKFEIDRFFYNGMGGKSGSEQTLFRGGDADAAFLAKPYFSREKIDYAPFLEFDVLASLQFGTLSFGNEVVYNANTYFSLDKGVLDVQNFAGTYLGGSIAGKTQLDMNGDHKMSVLIVAENQDVGDKRWLGKVYGIEGGKLSSNISLESSAASVAEMVENANGTINFDIADSKIKGWNLPLIYDDLVAREKAEGLAALVKNALTTGETSIERINGMINLTKGKYSFEKLNISAPNMLLSASGKGDLVDWSGDVSFGVKFLEPSYLPGFGFSWGGSLANPTLEENVDDLLKMYNDRQDEFAAMAKAREEKRLAGLRQQMATQQNLAKGAKSEITNVVLVDLKAKTAGALDENYAKIYMDLTAQAQKIDEKIEDIFKQALLPNIDEKLVEKVSQQNQEINSGLGKLQQDIQNNFVKELQQKSSLLQQEILTAEKQAVSVVSAYQKESANYPERLKKAESSYVLSEDDIVVRLTRLMESHTKGMGDLKKQVDAKISGLNDKASVGIWEDAVHDLESLNRQVQSEAKTLQQAVAELQKYAGERVALEEKKYQDKIKAAEIKRKLEENTGTISIKGTGKSLTVRRDIEDIEKSEEAQKNDAVKVLDFSGEKPKVQGVIRKQNTTPERPQSQGGILVRPRGEIKTPAGGVIRKN